VHRADLLELNAMAKATRPNRKRPRRARPLLVALGAIVLGGCRPPPGAVAVNGDLQCSPTFADDDLSVPTSDTPDLSARDLGKSED
jgi:hypothetical protein